MSTNRYARRPGPWRPAGTPYYLDAQCERLGLPPLLAGDPRVKDNRQLVRISGATTQACGNYFDAPRRGEDRQFADWQLAQIRAVLLPCEQEIGKVHVIAAAGTAMVDEAYRAFGLEPPDRSFRVVAASDAPAESVAIASLRADVARLEAEVVGLNRQVEQLTAPPPEPDPGPGPDTAAPAPAPASAPVTPSPPRSRPPAR